MTFSTNTLTPDPTEYTKRIPTVNKSWKKVPSVPRISFCAISAVYVGAVTQNAPPAMPRSTRPTSNIATEVAHVTSAQPTVNGITNNNIVSLRPIKFMMVPTKRHIAAAPKLKEEPIQDHSSAFTLKPYSPTTVTLTPLINSVESTTRTSVGDVQPNRVPAANAPPVANNIKEKFRIINMSLEL